MDEYPVIVEGKWASFQAKVIKNKLQIYFQSKKKSDGGDCSVEVTGDHSVRATVYFKCDEVKKRVLARDDHEMTIEKATIKLHLSLPASTNDDTEKLSKETPPEVENVTGTSPFPNSTALDGSAAPMKTPIPKARQRSINSKREDLVKDPVDADDGCGLRGSRESAHDVSMVLENIPEHMNRDMLSLLVETVSGLGEESFSLEIIWETKKAVVTLNNPSALDRFMGNEKFKRHGMAARLLEGAQTVRVENLTQVVIKDMLELYFENSWTLPVCISMIPEENAAVATFDDPKVVETISKIEDHIICKVPVKMYPFYESLGTALYGKDRPTWKMPEPFTESVHPPVWKFILMKEQIKAINLQMCSYFCCVELETPEAKLSPLPSLLKQKGLTARHVDEWKNNASQAFRELLSQYTAFEFLVNFSAWKMVEKDIRSVVREDAELVLNVPKGKLTMAGRAEDVNRIRGSVEEIILNAVQQIKRQSNSVSEAMDMRPAKYYMQDKEKEYDEDEDDNEKEGRVGGSIYCEVQTASGVLVSVSKTDICSFRVDAVVNAANEDLKHFGGLAHALLKAAGPQLQTLSDDYIARNGRLRPGDAIVTDACNLPCKYVVHAVGPRFSDSDRETAVSRLNLAIQESLRQAAMNNCSSIAVPAVSSGIFGFPLELCAETIARAVRQYCNAEKAPGFLTEIHLTDNNDQTVRALAKAVNNEFKDLQPKMTLPRQGSSRDLQPKMNLPRQGSSRDLQPKMNPPRQGSSRQDGYSISGSSNMTASTHWGKGRGQGGSGGKEGQQEHIRFGGEDRGRLDHESVLETTYTQEELKICLRTGNIQEQATDVIVNTIPGTLDLDSGAVSKAILEAAGQRLQFAVQKEHPVCDVIVTAGFNLKCQKVFHTICPHWDNGAGQAEEKLKSIIRYCLEEAEKLRLGSVSFPAIGTGYMCFPKSLVSRTLLEEIHIYSQRRKPQYLREVAVVLHPSDTQTVESFTREFKGQRQGNHQRTAHAFDQSSRSQSTVQSKQTTASFSQVSSPSLVVYQMKMGQLNLEVSSGDITKDTSDVIINSSNKDFNLKTGVSKAILDSAGLRVELECSTIVNSRGYRPSSMILTSAGFLPSRHILHIIGQKDPARIKEVVYHALRFCEEQKFTSVAFPALGTGVGGARPTDVADAMIDAVVEFVRKKHQRCLHSVKILVFQTAIMKEFHNSMKRIEVQDKKSGFTKFKAKVTSFFAGSNEERPNNNSLALEGTRGV